MQRATKIVATLGPASNTPDVLTRMLAAGVDVVRLNFSHGVAADHQERARMVRDAARALGREVAIMADLQGPKIRVGKFADGKVDAQDRQSTFILDAECELGDDERVGLDYKELPRDVAPGAILLLDDGLIRLRVESVARQRDHDARRSRRRAVEQQGHQPAGRRAHRAGADGQGHGRHEDRGGDRGRLPRGVVSRRTRKTCTWRASCCAPPAARRC